MLAEIGLSPKAIPVNRAVRTLPVPTRQMIEIAKAVSTRASVLIMDEPTAVLSGPEVAALFELVQRLRAGVTHGKKELFRLHTPVSR